MASARSSRFGGEQQVGERGADRCEHGEQEPREESADPADLEQRRREEHCVGLRKDVSRPDVGELVRDHGRDLWRRQRRQETGADRERGATAGLVPTTKARGKVSSISCSFGGAIWSCAATRSTVERSSGSSASANGLAPSIPSKRAVTDGIRGGRGKHRAETRTGQPLAGRRAASRFRRTPLRAARPGARP